MKHARVAILGFTFKENCPDTRNTRVIDIVDELEEHEIKPIVVDPVADQDEVERTYGFSLNSMDDVKDMDAVIIAVKHDCFKALTKADLDSFFQAGQPVLFDLKGIFDLDDFADTDYLYWRL